MVFTEQKFGELSKCVTVRVPKSEFDFYKKEIENLVQKLFRERNNKD